MPDPASSPTSPRRLDLRAKPPEPAKKAQADARYASVDRERTARDTMTGDIHTTAPPKQAESPSKAPQMTPSEGSGDGPTSPTKSSRPWSAGTPQYLDELRTQHSISSQKQLNDYREKLARDLERRELSARGLLLNSSGKRVSPIEEENNHLPLPPALNTTATNASTESGNTIRAGMTPANVASTPSYPFPRMASGTHGSKAFAWATGGGSRPSHMASFEPQSGAQDRVLSNNSTPASTFTFNPTGASPQLENLGFPNPNLYDLSLMLSAEPGLDAWWNTVVQIMKDVYNAERVTLSVPADTTDIENVPWGQKATYNEHMGDGLSLGYMGRGSSAFPTSDYETPGSQMQAENDDMLKLSTPSRPDLTTRHSWTGYDDDRGKSQAQNPTSSKRPSYLSRSRSYLPSIQSPEVREKNLSHGALEEHDMLEENVPLWEAPYSNSERTKGRVLPVLQALNYEADPLIDHAGVMRVLERGKAVTLTRTYPYLENDPPREPQKSTAKAGEPNKKPSKPSRSESASKRSSLFGGGTTGPNSSRGKAGSADKGKSVTVHVEEEGPRPPTPKYEEYEQAPPSPWAQSPAPSPAVRTDTKENPFFTDATVDEESFNPGSAPADYTGPPPEAIGIDNSWTVLHIPLTHVLQSRPTRPFKLNSAAVDQKAQSRGNGGDGVFGAASSPDSPSKAKAPAPIAVLSILSPVIPYPSNLRHSLEHLAPHMATSFSLCRHYENLETELAGIQRRRPSITGFGAVATDGRPLTTPFTAAEIGRQQSHCGSMTSPSEYSGVSKSMTGSPAGTPGWDQGSLSGIANKRQPAASPAAQSHEGESYFSSKQRPSTSRQDTFGAGSQARITKETSPEEKRHSRLSASKVAADVQPAPEAERVVAEPEESTPEVLASRSLKSAHGSGTQGSSSAATAEESLEESREKLSESSKHGHRHHGHTMLHSYGADFSSTFQSLPPSTSLLSRPTPATTPSRGMSYMTPMDIGEDLRPPTVRLKGLVLDALPAHVFVALPQTGEIVWVNSRYLSYRGQTVADLTEDPWSSIHPDECEDYLQSWAHSLRTGEQFSRTVRIKRFDGQYRWFYARAVASKDKRGVIQQFLGSYMDIHDQHIAELKAARQEEIEASEAKHRLLANLIPQIIFTATEEDGVTFANEQWLSYTGQSFEDSLGLGFLDFVHPEDLARCRIPTDHPPTPLGPKAATFRRPQDSPVTSETSAGTLHPSRTPESNLRGVHQALSRHNSSGNSSIYELPSADLNELAKKGIIKVGKDSNGRPSYTTEVRLRSKSGEYRWHLIRCVEIDTIDFGSGASSYFGSATDINDHKILETKLKEAMESKSRFLSNMSHEIRTPLIGISGMVSFLQDTVLNEEQRDYTNTIQTSANSLIMIINDILDLSKVDAGMMKLKFEWFHTRSLIEDVNELVSTMAIAKGLELNYLVEADVPAYVKGDKVRIRQVLLNIIGNAIKFTAAGEVFSHCKVISKDAIGNGENGIMLEYSVIDTGQGFSEQEAEMIFKPFSQIDGSSTRQHGGSGLGLVISKQLVELHGGKIAGSSKPGQGSTFAFSARFALPTAEDHPDLPGSPATTTYSATSRQPSTESVPGNFQPLPAPKQLREVEEASVVPAGDQESGSPVVTSNGSSNPSVQSARSHATDKSSATSVNTGLARFSEAAKASGQDLSQMKLEMPYGRISPGRTVTPSQAGQQTSDLPPPVYSILILCTQRYSREATVQHIEMTIPSDVPHQTTAVESVEEAQKYIGGPDPIKFTHIVINLASAEAVLELMDQISRSQNIEKTTILVLSDSVQRQAALKLAADTPHEKLFVDNHVTFIYKPVKPSRFAVIFDPNKMRDLSIDRNRSTAQQMVETQKASYLEIEKRMGNKGYKVLLVEDNPVNQKVLLKYLKKIGVDVDVACDGAECTDKVLSKPHTHYSLILCDLHMPRKDGYQACREIRHWEKVANFPGMPIIALSANVMADVQEKCVAAGFSDYITKPVDFVDLSRAMAKFF